MASYKYEGNDDFRGYVAANVAYSKNPTGLLSILGNDGKINWGAANRGVDLPTKSYGAGQGQAIQNYVNDLYGQFTAAKAQDAYTKSTSDILAAIRASQPPVPRMVNFDTTGSWAKAREMASNAVSPIYQQKLNDFVKRQETELTRQRADTDTQKSAFDQALSRFMEDSTLTRGRTAEDTKTGIADIEAGQAASERAEGLSFDQANRSLAENVAAGGMAESGLGAQQVDDAQMARRIVSNEQLRQSDNKVEVQNTLMNRTFQDLDVGETRKTADTTAGKQKLDLDMERFIEDQAWDRDQTTKQNELDKEADIAGQTVSYQGQLVDQWLASLSGKGYTAQEIANAASIYK